MNNPSSCAVFLPFSFGVLTFVSRLRTAQIEQPRLRIARTRKKGFLPEVLQKFQRRAEEVSLLILRFPWGHRVNACPFFGYCTANRAARYDAVLPMQSWDGLTFGLSPILLVELSCISCGVWRGAIEQEQAIYPCVLCQQPAKAAILCDRAFTRHPAIPWERVAKPFTGKIRELLLMDSLLDERPTVRKPKRFADRHRRRYIVATASG
jgi:hypothetical protein